MRRDLQSPIKMKAGPVFQSPTITDTKTMEIQVTFYIVCDKNCDSVY